MSVYDSTRPRKVLFPLGEGIVPVLCLMIATKASAPTKYEGYPLVQQPNIVTHHSNTQYINQKILSRAPASTKSLSLQQQEGM